MLIDGNALPAGTRIACDVCIIGGGPAGIIVASELAGRGLDVVLLESGGTRPDAAAEALSDAVDSGNDYMPLNLYRRRILGGTSTIWGGRCVPYDPIDFEARDWVPHSGWPIGRSDLAPHEAKAAEYCEIGLPEFDADRALPGAGALIEGFDSPRTPTNSFERFSPPTNFGRKWHAQLVAAPDVRVIVNSTCVGLDRDADGRIAVARVRTLADGGFDVAAARFVVACGGLETFRLLRLSGGAEGLGNAGGALGRYFMTHIEGTIAKVRVRDPRRRVEWGFPRSRDGIYGRRRIGIAAEEQRRARTLNFIMRFLFANPVDPRHGDPVLSAMFLAKSFILPEYRRKVTMVERTAAASIPQGTRFWWGHLRNLVVGSPRLAAFLGGWVVRRHMRYRRIPYVALPSRNGDYVIEFNGEQLPNPESRVYLADNDRDRFGMPKIGVEWRSSPQDFASIAANLRLVRDELAASGAATLEIGPDDELDALVAANAVPVGGHLIGMARMSASEADGVVDADLRVHRDPNVRVIGAAVFPTSSHANPTFTVATLAIRLAADLLRETGHSEPEARSD